MQKARIGFLSQLLLQRAGEARLADAGLSREQHDLALAVSGLLPAPQQQGELLLAADERREALPVQRLEPA